jgi:hypothetical protein
MIKFAVQVIIFESLLPDSVKVVKLMVDAQASYVVIVADRENPIVAMNFQMSCIHGWQDLGRGFGMRSSMIR